MLNNCRPERYAINKERMLRLAEYSRDCLRDLRATTGIHYEGRQRGTLQVFRSQAQLDAIARDTVVLAQAGVTYSILDRAAICRMEPGLHAVAGNLSGALHLPGDETGDCALFTRELAGICAAMGVRFCYNTSIEGLQCEGGRITGVSTSDGFLTTDHCVLALGSYSRALLGSVRIDVPVLSNEGVLAHGTDHEPGSRTDVDRYGRDLQGRCDSFRQSHSGRWHGGAQRIRPSPQPSASRHAGNGPERSVPRGWRCRSCELLDGIAPHDPGWHTHRWRQSDWWTLAEHRPRDTRLDNGGRLRTSSG
jgi:glycine/D-amino acid oxidase-like deaminating enzyme